MLIFFHMYDQACSYCFCYFFTADKMYAKSWTIGALLEENMKFNNIAIADEDTFIAGRLVFV